MSKKIISVFLIFAISLSMFALPVHAAEGKSTTVSSTGSFWQMVANSNSDFMQYLMGTLSNSIFGNGTVCPSSPDAKHYGSPAGAGRDQRVVTCRCKYCGELFTVDASVIESAYQDYVGGLDDPNASYGEGYVDFSSSTVSSLHVYSYSSSTKLYFHDMLFYWLFGSESVPAYGNGGVTSGSFTGFQSLFFEVLSNLSQDSVAIVGIFQTGSYAKKLLGLFPNEYGVLQWGLFENPIDSYNSVFFGVHSFSDFELLASKGSLFCIDASLAINDPLFYKERRILLTSSSYMRRAFVNMNDSYHAQFYCYEKASSASSFPSSMAFSANYDGGLSFAFPGYDTLDDFYIYTPSVTSSDISFSTEYLTHGPSGTTGSSRPGSIAGNWGVMGDDSTVNNIGNQVIVNEDSKTWYNPETGQNEPMESWTYDYATRTYNIVTGDGQTVTVAYGNENLTINKGDVTYNIYYMVDSSQLQESCKHSYTFVTIKDPTCKVAGLDQYTCDFCGHMYIANTSATGHTWKILRDVNTSYDENGALIQEGYTIYECEICGEQYKSMDGSAPPSVNNGGSSGSGSGSGDSSGGSIFDKLGEFWGTLSGGVVDTIGKIVEFVLDSLISLAEVVVEKGTRLIDLILSFFQRIPDMFGAFPQFLAAVFPFIPEDVMIILEFGLAAVVILCIINMLRK